MNKKRYILIHGGSLTILLNKINDENEDYKLIQIIKDEYGYDAILELIDKETKTRSGKYY